MYVSLAISLLKKPGHSYCTVFHSLHFANCFTTISTVPNNWYLELEVRSDTGENFCKNALQVGLHTSIRASPCLAVSLWHPEQSLMTLPRFISSVGAANGCYLNPILLHLSAGIHLSEKITLNNSLSWSTVHTKSRQIILSFYLPGFKITS